MCHESGLHALSSRILGDMKGQVFEFSRVKEKREFRQDQRRMNGEEGRG